MVLLTAFKAEHRKEQISKTLQMKTGEYLAKKFKARKGELNYRILYPNGFDENKKYPILLFLHGSGERGDDNEAQLKHGGEMIRKGMETHNGIVIFPQCPQEDFWIRILEVENGPDGTRSFVPDVESPPSDAMQMVIELMEDMKQKSYVEKSRIYVGGLSMGGMGTFDLCWRKPDLFAAAVPICGAGAPAKADQFVNLPMRVYHGADDQAVPVEESLKMIDALKRLGGNPESFIYPGVNHNSWDNAFAEPDFLEWIFKQQK